MTFPEEFRSQSHPLYVSPVGAPFGLFAIPGRAANGRELRVIACEGEATGWEHVSVSLPAAPRKCPSWEEMCCVKK